MGMGIIYKILGALRHSIQILKLKLMKAQKRKNDKGKVKILFIDGWNCAFFYSSSRSYKKLIINFWICLFILIR